ncbi:MAG: DUF4292 domain-containing protein [Hymenobacteraceae bacterium]|nr:DUF4292 domain-containing protein [Hymenobacteraceae bacterium]
MSKLRRPLLAFAALPLLLSAAACKKQVATGITAPAAPPVATVPAPVPEPAPVVPVAPAAPTVDVQNFDYQYLQIKGKVQYETSEDKQEAQVNIRMKRDSIIWASVSKVGFEGVRAVITRDTVVLLDRLHKSYFAGNFKSLKRKYRVPVTFDQLQAALVGNYLPGEGVRDASSAPDAPVQTLHHDQEKLAVEQFINRGKKRLVKLSVIDQRSGSALTADYADFKPLRAGQDSTIREFPFALLLTVLRVSAPNPATPDAAPKTLLISLNHKAVTVPEGKLDFPLAIPADYERKQ